MFVKGLPDTHATIEDIIAEGDNVWSRSTVTGTRTGEYLGLAPTGKKIKITGVDIRRMVEWQGCRERQSFWISSNSSVLSNTKDFLTRIFCKEVI